MNVLSWLFMFGIGVSTDIIWILWMTSVERMKPWRAGFWGMMTSLVGLVAVVDVVDNRWNAIPYLTGLFFGSTIGVYHKIRTQDEKTVSNK